MSAGATLLPFRRVFTRIVILGDPLVVNQQKSSTGLTLLFDNRHFHLRRSKVLVIKRNRGQRFHLSAVPVKTEVVSPHFVKYSLFQT